MNRRQRRRRARVRRLLLSSPVIAVAALWFAGQQLPARYHQEARRVLPNTRETLWTILTDLDGMPSWRQDLIGLERLPAAPGGMRWREIHRGGGLALEQVEAIPFERLVVRIAPTGDGGAERRWIYDLRPARGGTELAVIEEREIQNPLVRSLVRLTGGNRARIERLLRDLERRLSGKPQVTWRRTQVTGHS